MTDFLEPQLPEDLAPEEQAQQPVQQGPSIVDRAQDARSRIEDVKQKAQQFKERFVKKPPKVAEDLAKQGVKKGEEAALKGAEKKALQAGIKSGASRWANNTIHKGAAKAVTKVATGALTRIGLSTAAGSIAPVIGNIIGFIVGVLSLFWGKIKKYIKPILAGGAILLMMPIIIISLLLANQLAILARTVQQVGQTIVLAGKLSNPVTAIAYLLEVFNGSEKKLDTQIGTIYANDPAKAAQARQDVQAIRPYVQHVKQAENDPVNRKKAADELKAKVGEFANKYPLLISSGGSCADTKQYIDSGALKINAPEDARLLPMGRLKNIDGVPINANPRLCNALVYLASKGYKLGSITISNNHVKYVKLSQSSGKLKVSQHYRGEAFDIVTINGIGGRNPRWGAISKQVMQDLRDNRAQLHVYDLWGPFPLSVNDGKLTDHTISGHKTHIHVSFK